MSTFILDPIVVDLVEVAEVIGPLQGHWALIVENAPAVELVIEPLSIVCGAIGRIIKHSPAGHLVLLELPLVVSPILEHELALTVLAALQSCPLIPPSVLVSLYGHHQLLFLLEHSPLAGLMGHRRSFVLELRLQFPELRLGGLEHATVGHTRLWLHFWDWVSEGEGLLLEIAALACFVKSALFQFVDVLQVLADHLQQPWISVEAVFLRGRVFGSGETVSEWLNRGFLQFVRRYLIWQGEVLLFLLLASAVLRNSVRILLAEGALPQRLHFFLFLLCPPALSLSQTLLATSALLGLAPKGVEGLLHLHQRGSSIRVHLQNTGKHFQKIS